jgi:hypothetical protein
MNHEEKFEALKAKEAPLATRAELKSFLKQYMGTIPEWEEALADDTRRSTSMVEDEIDNCVSLVWNAGASKIEGEFSKLEDRKTGIADVLKRKYPAATPSLTDVMTSAEEEPTKMEVLLEKRENGELQREDKAQLSQALQESLEKELPRWTDYQQDESEEAKKAFDTLVEDIWEKMKANAYNSAQIEVRFNALKAEIFQILRDDGYPDGDYSSSTLNKEALRRANQEIATESFVDIPTLERIVKDINEGNGVVITEQRLKKQMTEIQDYLAKHGLEKVLHTTSGGENMVTFKLPSAETGKISSKLLRGPNEDRSTPEKFEYLPGEGMIRLRSGEEMSIKQFEARLRNEDSNEFDVVDIDYAIVMLQGVRWQLAEQDMRVTGTRTPIGRRQRRSMESVRAHQLRLMTKKGGNRMLIGMQMAENTRMLNEGVQLEGQHDRERQNVVNTIRNLRRARILRLRGFNTDGSRKSPERRKKSHREREGMRRRAAEYAAGFMSLPSTIGILEDEAREKREAAREKNAVFGPSVGGETYTFNMEQRHRRNARGEGPDPEDIGRRGPRASREVSRDFVSRTSAIDHMNESLKGSPLGVQVGYALDTLYQGHGCEVVGPEPKGRLNALTMQNVYGNRVEIFITDANLISHIILPNGTKLQNNGVNGSVSANTLGRTANWQTIISIAEEQLDLERSNRIATPSQTPGDWARSGAPSRGASGRGFRSRGADAFRGGGIPVTSRPSSKPQETRSYTLAEGSEQLLTGLTARFGEEPAKMVFHVDEAASSIEIIPYPGKAGFILNAQTLGFHIPNSGADPLAALGEAGVVVRAKREADAKFNTFEIEWYGEGNLQVNRVVGVGMRRRVNGETPR